MDGSRTYTVSVTNNNLKGRATPITNNCKRHAPPDQHYPEPKPDAPKEQIR